MALSARKWIVCIHLELWNTKNKATQKHMGPILIAWLNMPAWISNHMSSEVWDEITYSQTSTIVQSKFGNGQVILFHPL